MTDKFVEGAKLDAEIVVAMCEKRDYSHFPLFHDSDGDFGKVPTVHGALVLAKAAGAELTGHHITMQTPLVSVSYDDEGRAENNHHPIYHAIVWVRGYAGVGCGVSSHNLWGREIATAFGFRNIIQHWLCSTPEDWFYFEGSRSDEARSDALDRQFEYISKGKGD